MRPKVRQFLRLRIPQSACEICNHNSDTGSGFVVLRTSVKVPELTPGMIKTALARGDTDGTGDKIHYKNVFSAFVEAIWDTIQTKNIATAKVALLLPVF